MFRVRDKLGTLFAAAFYTPNPAVDARDCKVGTMLAVKNARPHRFLDGQVGFRIEDPSYIEVGTFFFSSILGSTENLIFHW